MIRLNKKGILATILILLASINMLFYWEEVWTLWAKNYVKNEDIVVSLTTTPHRINKIDYPLQCLSRQSIKVRQIYLNVPYVFKRDNLEYVIPEWIENYPNLTIIRTEDYGPATKILGTLKNAGIDNNTIIISVDDDTCYPENLVLKLAVRAKMYPDEAVGISGSVLDFEKNKEGGIVKIMQDKVSVPILEGFAGIAYRKSFFSDSVFEIKDEPDYCYNSDDLYLSFHLASQHITRKTLHTKSLNVYKIQQRKFGYEPDALYRLDVVQADRYKRCIDYLTQKFPRVEF